jgi:hypothetical protein
MAPVSYRRPAVGRADRADQDLRVYASGVFVEIILSRKRQAVCLMDDGQLFPRHDVLSFATSVQLPEA